MHLLSTVKLTDRHFTVGRTRHFAKGAMIERPSSLALAQFEGEKEVYLLYLDRSGNELTDTLHDDAEKAKQQAEFEFGVRPWEWTVQGAKRAR